MRQFEDEYQENLVLSIYNCAKGSDSLVNNSEFENLYYLMQVDSSSDVSFCLLDINSDGHLSIDEIVNATNQFAGFISGLEPISNLNYDTLVQRFANADADMDLTLDEGEFAPEQLLEKHGSYGLLLHLPVRRWISYACQLPSMMVRKIALMVPMKLKVFLMMIMTET